MTWGNEGSIWSSSLSAQHQTGGSCLPSPPRVTSKRPADSRCYPDLIIKKLNRENHMECRDLFAFFPWSGVFLLSLYTSRSIISLSIIIISYSSDPYLMSLFDELESEEWKGYIVLYEQRFRAATMRDLCFAKFGRKFFSLTVLFLMCLFRWDAVCSW